MWWFRKEGDSRIKSLVNHVKNYSQAFNEWVRYFNNRHTEQEERIKALEYYLHQDHASRISTVESWIHYMPKTKEDIHSMVNDHSTLQELRIKLEEIRRRIDELEPNKVSPKQSIREKVMSKLSKNSKQYVKNLIISIIRKYQKIPALELKEMVVDEQRVCSKSSFYRILAEAERENDIQAERIGREKIYFSNYIEKEV